IDRADMNAEQARVYDAAKQSTGIVGGPYHAYIRLPKVFEACQNLRATLASGPLTRREQQIVNLAVARHWNARYPWYAQARNSLPMGIEKAVSDGGTRRRPRSLGEARGRACLAGAPETPANRGLAAEGSPPAEKTRGPGSRGALVAAVGTFSMPCLTAAT